VSALDSGADAAGGTTQEPVGGNQQEWSDALAAAYSCATLPRFTAPEQIIDGIGDEFADIPPVTFKVSEAPWVKPLPPPNLPEVVTFRAAWSPIALHVHVHVEDPSIFINLDWTRIWDGDSVEFMYANSTTFSGRFDSTRDGGALHVGIAPPGGIFADRGVIYIDPAGASYRSKLSCKLFAARLVDGGYEVEVVLPWDLNTKTPAAGDFVGFQLAVNVQDVPKDASATYARQLTANLPMMPVDSPGCGEVYCDDRTWCRPMLAPPTIPVADEPNVQIRTCTTH
jgi:hypothetical protein